MLEGCNRRAVDVESDDSGGGCYTISGYAEFDEALLHEGKSLVSTES